MLRPQLRQMPLNFGLAKSGRSVPVRQFSFTYTVAQDQNQPSESRKSKPRPSSAAPNRRPHNPNGPPRFTQSQSRPPRMVDARSFAASKAGGEEQPKIIRSPRSRNLRAGGQAPTRKPKPSGKGAKGKRNSPRRARSSDNDDGEDAQAAIIEQIQQEQIAKSRPIPVRYEPEEIDFSTLKATWPSIPTGVNARSAAIYQKLSRSSGRIADGYLPPYMLGHKLLSGQTVHFKSETEKAGALEEAQRLSRRRADQKSQRTGEMVEPRNIQFSRFNVESDQPKNLMDKLARGVYPTSETTPQSSPVLSKVADTLRNNGTYANPNASQQFMAKLNGLF